MAVRNRAFSASRRTVTKSKSHFNARGAVDDPVFTLARPAVGTGMRAKVILHSWLGEAFSVRSPGVNRLSRFFVPPHIEGENLRLREELKFRVRRDVEGTATVRAHLVVCIDVRHILDPLIPQALQ